jgi:hypothetical protein
MFTKILAGTAGLAAFGAATPAAGQYGYNPYGYGSHHGYGYGMNTDVAAQQCTAAVQHRLYNRTSLGGILGSALGVNTAANARVLSVTRVTPSSYGGVRVRGLASSGRYAMNGYGPYGVGAYGAAGYGYAAAADLSFKCDIDSRGFVRDVDIHRR